MWRLRTGIILAGLAYILYILIPLAFPIHKGVAHFLDASVVSVYGSPDGGAPLVPIKRIQEDEFASTGKFVTVYINHSYDDSFIVPVAKDILSTIFCTLLLFLLTFISKLKEFARTKQS